VRRLSSVDLETTGLGQQDETAYQGIAASENEGIKTNLLNSLTSNLGAAQSAKTGLDQGTTDIAGAHGAYDAWGNSHNVSEGGNVADPSDYSLTIGNLGNQFRAAAPNLHDKVQSGAYLGRIRDMILGKGETPGLMELAGTEGYNPAQVTQTIAQYNNYLRQAGLNPNDPKWKIGDGVPVTGTAAGNLGNPNKKFDNHYRPPAPHKLSGRHK